MWLAPRRIGMWALLLSRPQGRVCRPTGESNYQSLTPCDAVARVHSSHWCLRPHNWGCRATASLKCTFDWLPIQLGTRSAVRLGATFAL